jgi:hypothetical protein
MHIHSLALLAVLTGIMSGCAAEQPTHEEATRGVARAERVAQPASEGGAGEKAPVIVAGVGIPGKEIEERLAEAAGAVVLEELVLDRALAKLVSERGVTVTRRDVEAERGLLLRSMQEDAGLNLPQAEGMLENVRRSRGLGPVRFAAMLERNAQLRALVKPEVEVSGEEVERAVAMEFGPAYRVRLIRMTDAREASKVRAKLLDQLREAVDPTLTLEEIEANRKKPLPQERIDLVSTVFAQQAVKVSTHETAASGGLVESLSPADEAYPVMVRQAMATTRPGDISEIFATREGVWMLVVEKALPAKGAATAADRERVKSRLVVRRERMEMDRLARELVASANVTVLDAGLGWSWEGRR